MGFVIVIPARYGATRLVGKPLREIAGKPLIQHVFERAAKCGAEHVVVATDDERIHQIAENFGAEVCMTSSRHRSGTDRLAEVARLKEYGDDQIIVNLQGDEPLMPPAVLKQVAEDLAEHNDASVATLCAHIKDAGELFDPHAVKVVMDRAGYALYFSRAPIPWDRETFGIAAKSLSETVNHYRHIGVYAYRAGFLRDYSTWPVCGVEAAESLEQLRVLWHGHRIHVAEAVAEVPPGVDTEEDLRRVQRTLSR